MFLADFEIKNKRQKFDPSDYNESKAYEQFKHFKIEEINNKHDLGQIDNVYKTNTDEKECVKTLQLRNNVDDVCDYVEDSRGEIFDDLVESDESIVAANEAKDSKRKMKVSDNSTSNKGNLQRFLSNELIKKQEESKHTKAITVNGEPSTGSSSSGLEIVKLDLLVSELLKDCEDVVDDNNVVNTTLEAPEFEHLDDNNKSILRFFWWDAFEDIRKQPGVVFLFGKTYSELEKCYVSCCVVIRNIERKLFFLPKQIQGNETQTQAIYEEISERIMKPLEISQFKAKSVTKKYAFDPEVPAKANYIEVRYSAKAPSIGTFSKQGTTYSRIFGTKSSYLEIFLLERKIKGPCWLDISNAIQASNPCSWCKLEFDCLNVTDVTQTSQFLKPPPPPLVVVAINMQFAVNPTTSINEICLISCASLNNYAVDEQQLKQPFQNHFCVMSPIEQFPLPFNFYEILNDYKTTTVYKMDSEKTLLNCFVNQFIKIDADLVVGHDLQGYQSNILFNRLNAHEMNNFDKLGRIKRNVPIKQRKLEKGLFIGRLVCDLKQSAKKLIKSRSYDLNSLCRTVLKVERVDFRSELLPKFYETCNGITELITFAIQDTFNILQIMHELNIIPLALQLANITGNLMCETLLDCRAASNEFLLLHAFYNAGYIVPDKQVKTKGQIARRKPTHSGGLVLEPKVGFYDKFVLVMDFNSLYPSIIQEYNICFSTIPSNSTEETSVLPDRSLPLGVLPIEVQKLVESRRDVKRLINSNPNFDNSNLKMRETALKLTANSMYGCLGFPNSRFYARNLASLITRKGREIFMNTLDLVRNNYEVIYGDTDSIMINTNLTDYDEVIKIGNELKQTVNKLYSQVELDIEAVYKQLLLVNKKRYAAVNLTKTNELKTDIKYKGLDIVRRDWSRLACNAGYYVIEQLFNDQLTHDERINNISKYLMKIKQDLFVQNSIVPLTDFVITKQLGRNPDLYCNVKGLPHVQVALRCNEKSLGHFRAGDTVPYVICEDLLSNTTNQQAYHLEELRNSPNLKIDVHYYLSQQIYPVIKRIIEPIEGLLEAYPITDWLGIDSTVSGRIEKTHKVVKFGNVENFIFKCSSCGCNNFVINSEICLNKCRNPGCKVRPIDCLVSIQTQLRLAINGFIHKYYSCEFVCEDPMCSNQTVRFPVTFRERLPICTSCKDSVLLRKYTEWDLYKQLSYFQYVFDLSKNTKKESFIIDDRIQSGYNKLKETVEHYLHRSSYFVKNLEELFSIFSSNECLKENETEPEFDYDDDDDEDEERKINPICQN